MPLGEAAHQKLGGPGRTVAGGGEAAPEAVSDEAALARDGQTDCGAGALLGQALPEREHGGSVATRQSQQGQCRR
jgi:hypothetical protein